MAKSHKTTERASSISPQGLCLNLAVMACSLFFLTDPACAAIKTVSINDLKILYKKGVRREILVGQRESARRCVDVQEAVKVSKVSKQGCHVGGAIGCSCSYAHLIDHR